MRSADPMKKPSPFLSKSKYLSGLQCHKLLWFYYNAKDRMPKMAHPGTVSRLTERYAEALRFQSTIHQSTS